MRIFYGKRRYVPDICPTCGKRGEWLSPAPTSFSDMLQSHLAGYKRGVAKDPFWRMPRWYGRCGTCVVTAELMRPNWFERLPKNDWKGGTITVPFLSSK